MRTLPENCDFATETETILRWVNLRWVDTVKLEEELRMWADFFAAQLGHETETFAEGLTPEQLAPGQEPYVDPPDLSPDAESRRFDVT